MKSKMIFVAAALLVMLMAGAAHAKSDGSFGTDCASCHANGIPGGKPKDPPPTDPPVTPPTDPPVTPPTDPPPADPPSTPPTDPPAIPPTDPPLYVASEHIGSVELATVWHYGSLDTAGDLEYVFYAAVETDTSVNLVDVITPKGNRLRITDEPNTVVDNIKTWFHQAGDVRVWECEATFGDPRELKGYGKGNYTVEVHHDGGSAEAKVKYGGTRPRWGIGASGGDEQKNDGQNKKAKGKSKKKSHKPKKPKDNDDDDDDDDEE